MISFLGLITFLLRLTLVIQSQAVEVLPSNFFASDSCISLARNENKVHSTIFDQNQSALAVCEAEEEEKTESEPDTLAALLQEFYAVNFSSKLFYNCNILFGTKALLGNRHLYDFFHSWKTHLN